MRFFHGAPVRVLDMLDPRACAGASAGCARLVLLGCWNSPWPTQSPDIAARSGREAQKRSEDAGDEGASLSVIEN